MIRPDVVNIKLGASTNILKVMFLNELIWPEDTSSDEYIRNYNRTRILNSDLNLDILATYNYGSEVYANKVRNSAEGYLSSRNGTTWGYYWTPNYDYLIVYHSGYKTVIIPIDDVLDHLYPENASSIELDTYTDSNTPPASSYSQLSTCTKVLHICFNGEEIAAPLVCNALNSYYVDIDSSKRIVVYWYYGYGNNNCMVILQVNESDDTVVSINADYIVNGKSGEVDVLDIYVNINYTNDRF